MNGGLRIRIQELFRFGSFHRYGIIGTPRHPAGAPLSTRALWLRQLHCLPCIGVPARIYLSYSNEATMYIEQFYDEGLAHASYGIIINGRVFFVDPARDPAPYYAFAQKHGVKIAGIFETHPHADFVSSHVEMHARTGAPIFTSAKAGVEYDHTGFDDGDTLEVGDLAFRARNTPGHSPDSITILLESKEGTQLAAFTGDTLFVGNVGRPDLREGSGKLRGKREELARAMYASLHDTLMKLDPATVVYPAHGPSSLCGKSIGDERTSTIGKELRTNPAMQPMSEAEFVKWLLSEQSFVPRYFPYDVEVNRVGAANGFAETVAAVKREVKNFAGAEAGVPVIDTRDEAIFKKGHLAGAINIQRGAKFETWLGSLLDPETPYYLVGSSDGALTEDIGKAAKIGYASFIRAAFVQEKRVAAATMRELDLEDFRDHPHAYTIVDIRNADEYAAGKFFVSAINIPLPELDARMGEIPTARPVVVHCAGGYRSAAGSSIVDAAIGGGTAVYDLSEAVNQFK